MIRQFREKSRPNVRRLKPSVSTMKSGIEEMCWKKMTVTGRTPARKKRKRGSACAAVERRRRVVVEAAPAPCARFLPFG